MMLLARTRRRRRAAAIAIAIALAISTAIFCAAAVTAMSVDGMSVGEGFTGLTFIVMAAEVFRTSNFRYKIKTELRALPVEGVPRRRDAFGEAFAQVLAGHSADHRASGVAAAGLLRLAGQLLPSPVRDRWLEEWRGELYELRVDGEPWWRRTAYLLDTVLRNAPHQAVIQRRHGRRAVE